MGMPILDRLLWPDRQPITDSERDAAIDQVVAQMSNGSLDPSLARQRLTQLDSARDRTDLRTALVGVSQSAGPAILPIVVGLATAAWLISVATCITLWLLIPTFGGELEWPWWIWIALGGAPIVAGLNWLMNVELRTSLNQKATRRRNP